MKEIRVLLTPVITEKATDLGVKGKYIFFVSKDATKVEIKKAFTKTYGAKVATVRVMRTHPKKRMMAKKKELIKRPEAKKAVITLKQGEKVIDINKIKVKS